MKEDRISLKDRSKLYKKDDKQIEKLEKIKSDQIQRELNECTFKPKINRNLHSSKTRTTSVNKVGY